MPESSLAATTKALRKQFEAARVHQPSKEKEEGSAVVLEVLTPVDLSENVFAKTMASDETETAKAETVRDKIAFSFSDPLSARQEDIEKFNQAISDFESYYASLQDASIDTDQQSIRELMERIKNSVAPEMRRMIDSLQSTNSNIGQCGELLGVLKVARELNKTIEELAKAIKASEEIIVAKETAERNLSILNSRLSSANSELADAKTAYSSAPRSFFGLGSVAPSVERRLKYAEAAVREREEAVESQKTKIRELDEKLQDADAFANDPRLKILRSFDMTQHGLREKISGAAQDTIDTVSTIRNSIRSLINRVGASETSMKGIVDKIENTRIDRTVLISAFSEAYETNAKQIETISEKLAELQANFDAAEPDSVEASRLRVELMKLTSVHKAMLSYNQRLDTSLKDMQTGDAKSVISANDAERVLQSVRNNREGFNTIATQTLPSVSEAMRLVLHQFADEQDQEFRMAIGQVTDNLGDTAKNTAEHALDQQKEFHRQKIAGIDSLIARLGSESTILGKALEEQVRASMEEEKMYRRVTEAANELRDGMNAATEIRSQVREQVRMASDDAAASLVVEPDETKSAN